MSTDTSPASVVTHPVVTLSTDPSATVASAAPGEADGANPGLRHRLPLYPSQFLVAMAIVSIGPLLHPMMSEFGVPLSRGGLVSAGLFLGNVSAIVILNTGLARLPARAILFSGTLLQAAALVLAGAATRNLWSLFTAYLFIGFGGALMNTTCWIWISAHMRQNRAAAALRMILFFALGMMAVPLILGLALDAGASWRWILVAEGGLAFLSGLGVVFLPLLDVPGRQNVRPMQFRQVLGFNPRLLLGIMVAGFMYVGAEMTINVWLPKFQIEIFGGGDTLAGFAVTLFWVGMIAGRLAGIRLTRRFAPARLLLFLAYTLAVFVVAVAFAPSQGASLVLSVGAGLGASASYGLIGSYAGRFPGWQSAVATSLFILSGGVGSITFPYLMGPLASVAGFRIALALVAVPALAYGAASVVIDASSR
jgi:FHS family glucose/mannose:H+ symporter-like MFS transporter